MTPQSTNRPVHRQSTNKCPKCGNPLRPSVDVAAREVTEESAQRLYCARCDHQQWATPKEPWNFDIFVRLYNEISFSHGGWKWQPPDPRDAADPLQDAYEQLNFEFHDLKEFAEYRYKADQLWD